MSAILSSRGLRGYAGGVLAGIVSAALFGVALSHADRGFVVLTYLSATPLFMAGLGAGVVSGSVASITGVAGLCLITPIDFAIFYFGIYALPSLALTILALRQKDGAGGKAVWFPEGKLLTAITLYPCLGFLLLYIGAALHGSDLLALTQPMMSTFIDNFKSDLDAEKFAHFSVFMHKLTPFLPALAGFTWMLVILLSMVAGQSSLKQQGWNLRPSFSIQNIFVENWIIFAAALTGVAGAFAPAPYNYVGANLSFMLFIPFMFVGFAVVHGFAASTKVPMVILVIYYLALSLPWTMVPVFFLTLFTGVLDQWIDFRRRFAGANKGG